MTMKLVRWSPLEDVNALREQIDRIFEPFSSPLTTSNESQRLANHSFPVEVTEKQDSYMVRVLTLGLPPEAIELNCTEKQLLIAGELKPRELAPQETLLMNQLVFGKFSKQLQFEQSIDPQQVSATIAHGILEIRIPKLEKSNRTSIPIQIQAPN